MNVTAKSAKAGGADELIRLNSDLSKRLTLLAERSGRKKATLIRKALEQLLDDEEDRLIAKAALEHNKAFPQRYTLEDIRREFDLDD